MRWLETGVRSASRGLSNDGGSRQHLEDITELLRARKRPVRSQQIDRFAGERRAGHIWQRPELADGIFLAIVQIVEVRGLVAGTADIAWDHIEHRGYMKRWLDGNRRR